MKTLLALALLVASSAAFADMWMLASSSITGTHWACTYSSPDRRYQTTILMQGPCPGSINR